MIKKNKDAEGTPKKKGKKRWIIIGVIVFLFIVIGAAGGKKDDSQTSSTPESSTDSTTSEEETKPTAETTTTAKETTVNAITTTIIETTKTTTTSTKSAGSSEEFVSEIKKEINDDIGVNEKITDVTVSDKKVTIFVDISKTDTSIFPLEQIAVSRASSITDSFLELDNYYELWNQVVVDFGDIGKVTCNKDDIVSSAFGNYFKIGSLDKQTEKKTMPETKAETVKPSPESDLNLTTGQKNALKSAESYIKLSAFSYLGLIEQLEYEKYSHEEAVYGADNCGADWNAEALESAKSYIEVLDYSYQGLLEQLEYDEFTSEQAKYGADNCDADWLQEAADCAESYMSISSFSRDELLDQLLYNGFTQEQAEHGVQSVGY